jgi:hypothetical protein
MLLQHFDAVADHCGRQAKAATRARKRAQSHATGENMDIIETGHRDLLIRFENH